MAAGFSVAAFNCANPFSKSGPINLSMDLKIPITLVVRVFRPVIDQVTRDPDPSDSMVNTVSLRAFPRLLLKAGLLH